MGQDQLNKAGCVGRDDIGKMYNCNVIGIWDPRHFLYEEMSKASLDARYSLDDPDMQGLIESLKAIGWKQPGEVWYIEDVQRAYVIFGNRRTFATEQINFESLSEYEGKNAGDPVVCRYKVIVKKTLTPALIKEAYASYADENNKRVGNDWMTVASAAAHELKIGVDVGIVLAHWPMVESETMLEQLTADDGVRAACPELQTALATGKIAVKKAIRIARLPLSEQVAAMSGKKDKPAKVTASVSMVKLRRVYDEIAADKSWEDTVTMAVLELLVDPTSTKLDGFDKDFADRVRSILTEKQKPTPKPKPPVGGLTDEEKAGTVAFCEAEAVRREQEGKE